MFGHTIESVWTYLELDLLFELPNMFEFTWNLNLSGMFHLINIHFYYIIIIVTLFYADFHIIIKI